MGGWSSDVGYKLQFIVWANWKRMSIKAIGQEEMFPSHSPTWWDDNYWFLSLHNLLSCLIEQVYLDYLEAGADIIIIASYLVTLSFRLSVCLY